MAKLRYSILDTILWVPSLKILPPVQPFKFANGVKLAICIFLFYFSCSAETQSAMKKTRKTLNLSLSLQRKRKVLLKEILYGRFHLFKCHPFDQL